MKKFAIAVLLLLTLNSVSADLSFNSFNGDFNSFDPHASGIPLSEIITVANYFGCRTWEKNVCVECSVGFYFNKKGVCCEVPSLCSKFNVAEGVCLSCYQGYEVRNTSCKLTSDPDTGCAKWDDNNVCLECSRGWWMNNGRCNPVSDQCSTWDSRNGDCVTCYGGYVLQNGACIAHPNPFKERDANPLCAIWEGSRCTKCAFRAYFDSFGVCTPVADECQTWDPLDGNCLTCYGGYELSNGVCRPSQIKGPSDPGCSIWNGQRNVCLRCSERYVFIGGQCVQVSDHCKSWGSQGRCTSCYDGYDLNSDGTCTISDRFMEPTDKGCGLWDWKEQKCIKCSNNWVFNNQGICIPVSDHCQTFDLSGNCRSCYKGYRVIGGRCERIPDQKVQDQGCANWDWDQQVCLRCSERWVFNNQKRCVPVSDQCRSFNRAGDCSDCYEGYSLVLGKCERNPDEKPSDEGCAKWNWKDRECTECSVNWVFNGQGKCIPVSDQCKTFDLSGNCRSCYEGYNLVNGRCNLAPVEKPSDAGCALWDWKNRKCIQCSDNWVRNNQGMCIPVSDQCKTFDLAGNCRSCYDGYNLVGGKCELAPIQKPKDAGCALWDWKDQNCIKCSNNWVFNGQGMCIPVSDQCKTFDLSGNCRSCYDGYNLVGGKCELAPLRKPSDAGCGLWDWKEQRCLKCSERHVLSTNGMCVPVSDQCRTFNQGGQCTSCYKGYRLVGSQCEVIPDRKPSDAGCGKWDWDQDVCLECSYRYVFNNAKKCVPVNDQCDKWNSRGDCTSCYPGYVLNNGICTPGNSLCMSSNSNGACTTCYTGYILDNGNCIPISKLANLALYYSQCCPERLATLTKEMEAKP